MDLAGGLRRLPAASCGTATHKGTYGHLAILAGSLGFHGAAVMAAHGAQRARPGLITLHTMESVYYAVAPQLASVMVSMWQPNSKWVGSEDAILLGPGLAAPDLPDRPARALLAHWKQAPIRLAVNGRVHDVGASPDTALLHVLRNDLELNGPKYGCGLGECGTCTVLIDGLAARSCVIPIEGCVGRDVVTLEGLGSRHDPDPVQEAFITENAAQCGYCLNGMIMTTKALLMRNPHPTEQEALEALRYNLCRCGAHVEIIRAVMRAAGQALEARD